MIRRCKKKDLDKKHPKHKWCLYSNGRVVGRHRTERAAECQKEVLGKKRGKKKKK